MLALRGVIEEPREPPLRRVEPEQVSEHKIGQVCKQASFELHAEMAECLDDSDDDVLSISRSTVSEWMQTVFELNARINQYTKLTTARIDRVNIDQALLRQSFLSDVLDREATHSATLETLVRVQDQVAAKAGGSSSNSAYKSPVMRAAAVVCMAREATKTLTSDVELYYVDASDCANAAMSEPGG